MPKIQMLPAIGNQWAAFLNGNTNQMLGMADEIELPELPSITDTLNGAGVWGEVDIPATGQLENLSLKVKWNVLGPDFFELMDTVEGASTIMFLQCAQFVDPVTSAMSYKQVKVVVKGLESTANLGTLTKGKKSEPELEMNLTYIKIDIEDYGTMLEIDKFNGAYVVNGKDRLAPIKQRIGLGG